MLTEELFREIFPAAPSEKEKPVMVTGEANVVLTQVEGEIVFTTGMVPVIAILVPGPAELEPPCVVTKTS